MERASNSTLTICGLNDLEYHSARGVTHVLSILDPDWPEPEACWAYDPHHRITLHFHDAIEPVPDIVLPEAHHVADVLSFGSDLARDAHERNEGHLLVHGHMGLSRSTAAMTMLLAQACPEADEDAIVRRLLTIRPPASSALITFLDEMAYPEARNRARACRGKGDRAGDRFWSKVAVTIARRTGREIGLRAADRYERARVAQPDPELMGRLRAINRALSTSAHGQHVETELHNLKAHVLQAVDLVPTSPEAIHAAHQLVQAATELASARVAVRSDLDEGRYPPELEAAGRALERFRLALIQRG